MLPPFFIKTFSTRTATVICILLAVAVRMFYQYYTFDVLGDKSFQLAAAKQLLAGQGLTLAELSLTNPAETLYRPLTEWPPAYSVLAALFARIFNGDFIQAALWIDLLSVLPFIYVCRRLLFTTGAPLYTVNLFTLFSGFFFYRFNASGATDTLSLTLLLFAFDFCLRLMHPEKAKNNSTAHLVLMSICLVACYSFRYMYLPVIFLFPLLLTAGGWLRKNKINVQAGVYSFLLILAGVLVLLWYQRIHTGSPAFLATQQKGVYAENLKAMYPFLPATLFNPDIFSSVLESRLRFPFVKTMQLFQGLNLVLFFVLLLLTAGCLKRSRHFSGNKKGSFLLAGSMLSVAVAALLILLSLVYEPVRLRDGTRWTYVSEPRYYAFITVFIQLAVFAFWFRDIQKTGFYKMIQKICLLAVLAGFIHDLYFTVKTTADGPAAWHHPGSDHVLRTGFDQSLQLLQRESGNQRLVFTSGNINMINLCALKNLPVIYDTSLQKSPALLKPDTNAALIFIIEEKYETHFRPLLDRLSGQIAAKDSWFHYYRIDANKNNR